MIYLFIYYSELRLVPLHSYYYYKCYQYVYFNDNLFRYLMSCLKKCLVSFYDFL